MFLKVLTAVALFFAADARKVIPAGDSNSCVSFQVSAGTRWCPKGGTGCSWMCNYCANTLGTTNYYFTDGSQCALRTESGFALAGLCPARVDGCLHL